MFDELQASVELIKSWSRDFGPLVQLVSAVVLVGVTWRYVWLTSKLLEAQIDPAILWDIDESGNQPVLRITNRSVRPITGLLVSGKEIRFYSVRGKLERTSSVSNPRMNRTDVLHANEIVTIELGEIASKAVLFAENQRKLMGSELSARTGGLMGPDDIFLTHLFEFRISFERQLDRKPYMLNTGPLMPWTQDGETFMTAYVDLNRLPRPDDFGLQRDIMRGGA